MKTSAVVGIVVAIHCALIGSLLLMPGCGTTKPKPKPKPTVMPPAPVEPRVQASRPIVVPPPVVPVAPVHPVAIVPPIPPKLETKTYVVESSDTLSEIAKRFNVNAKDILQMNNLKNANVLRVGQKLQLPGYVDLKAPKPPRKPRPQPKALASAEGGQYVVQAGDVLSAIAQRHGTTTRALRDANGLTSDHLKIGQKLAIPGGTKATETASEGTGPVAEPVTEPKVGKEPGLGASTGPSRTGAGAGMTIHVVDAGQTLDEVAMMYNVSIDGVMKANNMTNTTLKPGQSLKIPLAQQ